MLMLFLSNYYTHRPIQRSNGMDDFEPWSMRRAGIVARYTTNEKLAISFGGAKGTAVVKSAAVDKTKARLGELEDLDEGGLQEQLDMSQQDFIKRIEDLNQELKDAWEMDGRVKSLKIAIQAAKLLAL